MLSLNRLLIGSDIEDSQSLSMKRLMPSHLGDFLGSKFCKSNQNIFVAYVDHCKL